MKKAGVPIKNGENREYTDAQIWTILQRDYGPVKWKWMPEIIFSRDFLISEFAFQSFNVFEPHINIASHFANRGHQTEKIAFVEYSVDGFTFGFGSFFRELNEIYNYARDVRLSGLRASESRNQVTKCLSCGSTDLSIRGSHLVCDYCQSKYAK